MNMNISKSIQKHFVLCGMKRLVYKICPAGSLSFPLKLQDILDISKIAFTRCRHILKMVKNSTDRPPFHMKTTNFLPADFENGRF